MPMVGSLVVPALLLAYAAWAMWNATYDAADDRIVRSLDVLHEQTLKVLKTGELVLDEITHDVQYLSDEQIRPASRSCTRALGTLPTSCRSCSRSGSLTTMASSWFPAV